MLSKRLKIARKRKKLTQEDLAKILKTTKGTVSNYENGHSSPSTDMLKDIADALEVDTDYLLGRTDLPKVHVENKFSAKDEVRKILMDLQIDDVFFHDIEAWENFTEEDIAELKKHFEWVAHKAKERNREENNE